MLRMGSSPLTRGKLEVLVAPFGNKGLIPAHAGKTTSARPEYAPIRAHPRSRGENPTSRGVRSGRAGSSPLTRGKRVGREAGRYGHGLIPAHAGKTGQRPAFRPRYGAHPRSRGENPPAR